MKTVDFVYSVNGTYNLTAEDEVRLKKEFKGNLKDFMAGCVNAFEHARDGEYVSLDAFERMQ